MREITTPSIISMTQSKKKKKTETWNSFEATIKAKQINLTLLQTDRYRFNIHVKKLCALALSYKMGWAPTSAQFNQVY